MSRNTTLVKHFDFDELMLLIMNEFELKHPDQKRIERIFDNYRIKFKELDDNINMKPESSEKTILEGAAEKAAKEFDNWYAVEFEARRFFGESLDKAEQIYKQGLEKFPKSTELIIQYASFLFKIKRDFTRATEYYKKAIEIEPSNVKDYEKAGLYYKKALEINPNHEIILGSYAIFLSKVKGEIISAENYYLKSIESNPGSDLSRVNYAGFLFAQGRFKEGMDNLNKIINSLVNKELILECNFYLYAHTVNNQAKYNKIIKKLITKGIRSPLFSLTDNVNRAIEDGHPEPEFLKTLAKVISDELDVKELDQFEVWRNIKIDD